MNVLSEYEAMATKAGSVYPAPNLATSSSNIMGQLEVGVFCFVLFFLFYTSCTHHAGHISLVPFLFG